MRPFFGDTADRQPGGSGPTSSLAVTGKALAGGASVGSYFLDDRAAVTALLDAARQLRGRDQRPVNDVYLVFTTNEEIGGVGGSYASASLPGTLTLALEVGNFLVAFGQSGLPYYSSRQGHCRVWAKRPSPEIGGSKMSIKGSKMLNSAH